MGGATAPVTKDEHWWLRHRSCRDCGSEVALFLLAVARIDQTHDRKKRRAVPVAGIDRKPIVLQQPPPVIRRNTRQKLMCERARMLGRCYHNSIFSIGVIQGFMQAMSGYTIAARELMFQQHPKARMQCLCGFQMRQRVPQVAQCLCKPL